MNDLKKLCKLGNNLTTNTTHTYMNKDLLLKVKEQILKEPRQFMMDRYYCNGPLTDDGAPIPNCGTAACIAGWAIVLHRGQKPSELITLENDCNMWKLGSEALGIDDYTAEELFTEDGWEEDDYHAYADARETNNLVAAAIAARVIDKFIARHES